MKSDFGAKLGYMLLAVCLLFLIAGKTSADNAPPVSVKEDYGTEGDERYVGSLTKIFPDFKKTDSYVLQNKHFKIVKTNYTAALYKTKENLDRETVCSTLSQLESKCTMEFNIFRKFQDPTKQVKILKLVVIVEDVNDHAPVFPVKFQALEIPEDAEIGYFSTLESATDSDVGTFGIQNYSLSGYGSEMFSLVERVRIDGNKYVDFHIDRELDRETVPFYNITLTARDGGSPPKTASIHILITVIDVNDNAPVFDFTKYEPAINEQTPIGTVVVNVSASDIDEGRNGEVFYKFTPGMLPTTRDTFNINQNTGIVTLARKVDYSKKKEYKIAISALDKGTPYKSTQVGVTINIVDVNDQAPQIKFSCIECTVDNGASNRYFIKEGIAAKSIGYFEVSDQDTGDAGRVSSLKQTSGFNEFELSNNGFLNIKIKLDREDVSTYYVNVTAHDYGDPPLTTVLPLTFIVEDVNDNSPICEKSQWEAMIGENTLEKGRTIAQITATDADSGENGHVEYSIRPGKMSDKFFIETSTGRVSLREALDREAGAKFNLNIIASDMGVLNRRQTICTIKVTVTDQNDSPPVFQSDHYRFTLPEHSPIGFFITQFFANDPDENSQTSYVLDTSDRRFTIEPDSGILRANFSFDRESEGHVPSIKIRVRAFDVHDTSLFSTTDVYINIGDINDHTPVISLPAANADFFVPWDAPQGYVILTVNASDADIGMNKKLRYDTISTRKVKGEHNLFPGHMNYERFSINQNGVLSLRRNLTYPDQGVYSLELQVSDAGAHPQVALTTIKVHVTNETLFNHTGEIYKFGDATVNVSFFDSFHMVPRMMLVAICCIGALVILLVFLWLFMMLRYRRPYKDSRGSGPRSHDVTYTRASELLKDGDIYSSGKQPPPEPDAYLVTSFNEQSLKTNCDDLYGRPPKMIRHVSQDSHSSEHSRSGSLPRNNGQIGLNQEIRAVSPTASDCSSFDSGKGDSERDTNVIALATFKNNLAMNRTLPNQKHAVNDQDVDCWVPRGRNSHSTLPKNFHGNDPDHPAPSVIVNPSNQILHPPSNWKPPPGSKRLANASDPSPPPPINNPLTTIHEDSPRLRQANPPDLCIDVKNSLEKHKAKGVVKMPSRPVPLPGVYQPKSRIATV